MPRGRNYRITISIGKFSISIGNFTISIGKSLRGGIHSSTPPIRTALAHTLSLSLSHSLILTHSRTVMQDLEYVAKKRQEKKKRQASPKKASPKKAKATGKKAKATGKKASGKEEAQLKASSKDEA